MRTMVRTFNLREDLTGLTLKISRNIEFGTYNILLSGQYEGETIDQQEINVLDTIDKAYEGSNDAAYNVAQCMLIKHMFNN